MFRTLPDPYIDGQWRSDPVVVLGGVGGEGQLAMGDVLWNFPFRTAL